MLSKIKTWLSRRKVRKMILSPSYLSKLDTEQKTVQACRNCFGLGKFKSGNGCNICNGVGLIIVRNVTDPCVDMIPEFVERWDKGMAKWNDTHKYKSYPVEFVGLQFLVDNARKRMGKKV